MKSFGRLLRTYIERSGYTNYGIAQKEAVNRTTLQKVLADERTPSPEFMKHILPLLKLTPEESYNFMSVFEMLQTGETLFSQRQYIKQIFECIPGINQKILDKRTVSFQKNYCAHDNVFTKPELYHGRYEVENLLSDLLVRECASSSPSLRINVPANMNLFKQIFIQTIRHCPDSHKLVVQHLTCFLKSEGFYPPPPNLIKPSSAQTKHANSRLHNAPNIRENLDILANTLPFLSSTAFHYEVYYYYDNFIMTDDKRTAFPYYVLYNDTVVFLSADCNTALPFQNSGLHDFFNNLFEAALQNSNPFTVSCSTPEDALCHLIEMDMENRPFYSLEYQPCFASYLNEKLIQTYAKPDIMHYAEIIEMVNHRVMQLKKLDFHVSIFSKSGLINFAETGFIDDFPREYINSFSVRDRIALLEKLYEDISSDTHAHRLVNPLIFPISRNFVCHLHQDIGLDFNFYELNGGLYCYIHIIERTLLEAFFDFFQYMTTSSLVCSREDTLSAIRQCIEELKN